MKIISIDCGIYNSGISLLNFIDKDNFAVEDIFLVGI